MLAWVFVLSGLLQAPPVGTISCSDTIPELVELMRPNPVERHTLYERVDVPFSGMAASAEIIVEGNVRPVRTYLSDNKCTLYTDYEITSPSFILGGAPPPASPGPQRPLVWRQVGGTMTIDGVNVIVDDALTPWYKAGDRLIVMLTRLPGSDRLELVASGASAFRVQPDGTIRQALAAVHKEAELPTRFTRQDFTNSVAAARRP